MERQRLLAVAEETKRKEAKARVEAERQRQAEQQRAAKEQERQKRQREGWSDERESEVRPALHVSVKHPDKFWFL